MRFTLTYIIISVLAWLSSVNASNEEITIAKIGQFPFIVYIGVLKSTTNQLFVGALITPKYVVTSAHFISKLRKTFGNKTVQFYVKPGEIYPFVIDPSYGTHNRFVDQVATHYSYDPDRPAVNDVGLLRCRHPFEVTNTTAPKQLAERPFPGNPRSCRLIGFDLQTVGHLQSRAPTLEYADVKVGGETFCSRLRAGNWSRRLLCAAPLNDRSNVTCPGYSGGVLLCENVLTGVLTSGLGERHEVDGVRIEDKESCDLEDGFPVFTFLGFYYTWFREYDRDLPEPKLMVDSTEKYKKRLKTDRHSSQGVKLLLLHILVHVIVCVHVIA